MGAWRTQCLQFITPRNQFLTARKPKRVANERVNAIPKTGAHNLRGYPIVLCFFGRANGRERVRYVTTDREVPFGWFTRLQQTPGKWALGLPGTPRTISGALAIQSLAKGVGSTAA